MISSETRKQLFRQRTCPAVVNGKDAIPFCIPAHRKIVDGSATSGHGKWTWKSDPHGQQRHASSLGSLNKDLYIVDQHESQENGDGLDGFFSSSSPAKFPPEHVGRVWSTLNYDETTETLVLSLLKARNLKRCDGANQSTNTNSKTCHLTASCGEQHKSSPSLRLKRKLFAMSRRNPPTGRKNNTNEKTKVNNEKSDIKDNTSEAQSQKMNSLVKIYLLPDERVFGQAKCKKHGVDPVFVDRFVFQISKSERKSRSLRMVFVEIDENKKHHVIGHVTRPLWNCRLDGRLSYDDLERGRPPNCRDSLDSLDSEILVSLCYDVAFSRLTIILLRMRIHMRTEKDSEIEQDIELKFNICGKSAKLKKCKTRRQVARDDEKLSGQAEFVMNEAFRFNISPEEFEIASLVINVKSKTRRKATTSCVALGGYMFARGSALEHWTKMTNTPQKFVQSWHHLISSATEEG